MRSGRLGAVVLIVALVLMMGILAMVLRIVAPRAPAANLAARVPLIYKYAPTVASAAAYLLAAAPHLLREATVHV